MRRFRLFPLSLSLLPLAFSGCVFETSSPVAPAAVGESASGLPGDGYIAFFDGHDTAAAPYVISDGMVVVDGDIVLGKAEDLLDRKDADPKALGKTSGNIMTSAMPGQANHWPSGRIPFVIETDEARKTQILAGIREWNEKAPVTWVPKTNADVDYVAFVNGTATNSSMGKVGGRQIINFGADAKKNSALHEMGHASGLYHEQQRSDRSSNVNSSFSSQLVDYNNYDFTQMGTNVGAYDHKSIMHYSAGTYYFTWNATCGCWKSSTTATSEWIILENQPGRPAIAPSATLSAGDLQTLRSVYVNALPYDAATTQSLTTGIGWPIVRPFKSGGVSYILHYNTADGQFRTYPFSPTLGMIDNPVEWGTWNSGWTMIEFYVIGSQTYALFYNRNSGLASFWTINANGKLGTFIENQNWWANWDIARVYKPNGTTQRFIFLYTKGSGLAQIYALKANGALDLSRNTYSQTLYGYEDFQTLDDVRGDWNYSPGFILPVDNTCLLYHDQQSSTQFLQVLNKTGGLGQWVTTAGVGTGFTQVNVYSRNNRAEAMYYNKSNGKLMIFDIRPVFEGNVSDPPMSTAGMAAIRSYTISSTFQVYNFNVYPWGNAADPKGAERLLLYDPTLKRFWNSNLAPFPSI